MESSYNGWPASPDPKAIGIDPSFSVAGVSFPGGVKAGDVAVVLGYVASEFHSRIEELVAGWGWGYEFRYATDSPEALSCHASGTALDLNSPLHPRGTYGTFTDAQIDQIEQLLADAGDVVRWGGTWGDDMHFEIAGSPDQVAAAARALSSTTAPPPSNSGSSHVTGEPTVTDAELSAIASKVWAYMVGAGGAGASLEEVRKTTREMNAKLSKLCDPRNGNVDATG